MAVIGHRLRRAAGTRLPTRNQDGGAGSQGTLANRDFALDGMFPTRVRGPAIQGGTHRIYTAGSIHQSGPFPPPLTLHPAGV